MANFTQQYLEDEKELISLETQSETTTDAIVAAQRLELFLQNAAPTASNLALAEEQINSLEEIIGVPGLIKFTDGSLRKEMQELDEEGFKETGKRIWRALSDLIRRIIAIFTSKGKSNEKNMRELEQQVAKAKEIFEASMQNSARVIDELKLTPGQALDKEAQDAVDAGDKEIIVTGDRKVITNDRIKSDILRVHSRKTLVKRLGILSTLKPGTELSEVLSGIQDAIRIINAVKSIGANTDLTNYFRKILEIRTEKDLVDVIQMRDNLTVAHVARINETQAKLQREFKDYKTKIPVGSMTLTMGVKKTIGIEHLTGIFTGALPGPVTKRVDGTMPMATLSEIEEACGDLVTAVRGLGEITEFYVEELKSFDGDRCTGPSETVDRLRNMEVFENNRKGLAEVISIIPKISDILRSELTAFTKTSDAGFLYADLVSKMSITLYGEATIFSPKSK